MNVYILICTFKNMDMVNKKYYLFSKYHAFSISFTISHHTLTVTQNRTLLLLSILFYQFFPSCSWLYHKRIFISDCDHDWLSEMTDICRRERNIESMRSIARERMMDISREEVQHRVRKREREGGNKWVDLVNVIKTKIFINSYVYF